MILKQASETGRATDVAETKFTVKNAEAVASAYVFGVG